MPRIFVAIPIPPDVAAALVRALPALPALRTVAPENLHVTLAFVGSIAEERVAEVSAAATRAVALAAPFDVTLGPLGRFPPSGSPTVVWAGLGSAAADIDRSGAALRKELGAQNIPFDPKPLRPHVTLGRVRERADPERIAAVGPAIDAAALPAGLSFRAEAVHVIESTLGRAGARYTSRSQHLLSRSNGPARGSRRIESAVEERLRGLAEKGELSGLPGEGKPFPRESDLAGDRWAAFHVMSNERVLPAWAELRHEIDESAARLVARARRHLAWLRARDEQLRTTTAERIFEARATTLATDQRVKGEIVEAVAELNQLVQRYEVAVPVASLQMPRFTLERIYQLAREGAP